MTSKPVKKSTKAADVLKAWLKENCTKGEMLSVTYSPTVFVLTKTTPTFISKTSWSYTDPKKPIKSKRVKK